MAAPIIWAQNTITTDGTEQDIFNPGFGGVYTAVIDLRNMAGGDTVVIRRYAQVPSISGSGDTLVETHTYSGVNALSCIMEGFSNPDGLACRVTIQKTAGTNRSYGYLFTRF